MAQKQRGATRSPYLLWGITTLVIVAVIVILALTIFALQSLPSASFDENPHLQKLQSTLFQQDAEVYRDGFSILLTQFSTYASQTLTLVTLIIGILMATIILLLILSVSQVYMWNRDRKLLEVWREAGFMCERLEFLPANRLKLNNIELELNKTQIENLKKLARHRTENKPLHSLDIGDHGVQAIKRLREELGSKFIEKSLVKIRKGEGYWLEVDANRIHGLPEQ